jgi:hypothetical protein
VQAAERENASPQAQPQTLPQRDATAQIDFMGQLERLGELHQKGILTDEEFDVKKAYILSRV